MKTLAKLPITNLISLTLYGIVLNGLIITKISESKSTDKEPRYL